MYKIAYELFGFSFEINTDSREMSVYFKDVLEKHVVAETQGKPDFELFIPYIDPIRRRYLTRTAPDVDCILNEIEFNNGMSMASWQDKAPPLIPFSVAGIESEFVAYHSAVFNVPDKGAIMLLGNKGAGKSTNSLALCKSLGWSLLSDETCVVRSKDLAIQALLRQPHGYKIDEGGVVRKSVLKFSENSWINTQREAFPIIACELIFIPGVATPHIEKVSDQKIGQKILGRHQLEFGSSVEAAQFCNSNLVEKVDLYQVYHGGYPTFSGVQDFIVKTVKGLSK